MALFPGFFLVNDELYFLICLFFYTVYWLNNGLLLEFMIGNGCQAVLLFIGLFLHFYYIFLIFLFNAFFTTFLLFACSMLSYFLSDHICECFRSLNGNSIFIGLEYRPIMNCSRTPIILIDWG